MYMFPAVAELVIIDPYQGVHVTAAAGSSGSLRAIGPLMKARESLAYIQHCTQDCVFIPNIRSASVCSLASP